MSPADDETFRWQRRGRSRAAIASVLSLLVVLVLLVFMVDASPWLMAVMGLFTLPACWDVWTNPLSGLAMDADGVHWFTGRRAGEVLWREIDHVRLDTRLDFSVRATLVLATGARVRLPYEATPPHRRFEQELNARGIRTERHHFTLGI